MLRIILFIASIVYLSPTTLAFLPAPEPSRSTNMSRSSTISAEALVDPTQRDAHYGGNVAQYLVDLHDTKSTFNFCGGMMFQREWLLPRFCSVDNIHSSSILHVILTDMRIIFIHMPTPPT